MKEQKYLRIVIDGPVVVHEQGSSFESKESNTRRIMMNVGKLIFVKKHHPVFVYHLYKILYSITILIQLFLDLLSKKYTWSENIKFLKSYRNEKFV